MKFDQTDFNKMDKFYNANFINSLSGIKSANLIGTKDSNNQTNLAIFSSIIHIGSNPPLLGFINRPHSVERHTLEKNEKVSIYLKSKKINKKIKVQNPLTINIKKIIMNNKSYNKKYEYKKIKSNLSKCCEIFYA